MIVKTIPWKFGAGKVVQPFCGRKFSTVGKLYLKIIRARLCIQVGQLMGNEKILKRLRFTGYRSRFLIMTADAVLY